MNNADFISLVEAIYIASKNAFSELFKNNEHYYFCSLVTTEDGMIPAVSAWSHEALSKCTSLIDENSNIENIKWSSEDSPYYCYGVEYFNDVESIILKRPSIDDIDEDGWDIEIRMRIRAMEYAIKRNADEGLFSTNQPRDAVILNVELAPPQEINTEIAYRLNKPSSLLTEYVSVNS